MKKNIDIVKLNPSQKLLKEKLKAAKKIFLKRKTEKKA